MVRLPETEPAETAEVTDPVRLLAAAARLVRDATSGVVLCCGGGTRPLPGLVGGPLLGEGSALLDHARSHLDGSRPFASFLWACGGPHAPDGHVRVSVLGHGEDSATDVLGAVVLSRATDLQGLTPRELEVLGLLVDGCGNAEIAEVLVVAPRTVATHVEHILAKLEAPTRTLAAVRAERDGLYVHHRATGRVDRVTRVGRAPRWVTA